MKEEGGVTEISLENIEELVRVHGNVHFIQHWTYPKPDDPHTDIYFEDGFMHTATGFSTGYRGTGPHGLLKVITKRLGRDDITIEHIAKWKKGHTVWMILSSRGAGGQMITHSCSDMEYDLEIW
jgi:hypothetical protein